MISLFIKYPNEKSLKSWQWFILLLLFNVPKWGSASHRHYYMWLSQIFIEGTVPYHLPLFQSDQVKNKKFAWAHRIWIQICLILCSYFTKQVETSKQESLNWPCACTCVLSHFSHVQLQLFATLWTVAHQALLSMGILQARMLELGCHTLFQRVLPPQGSNLCLLWLLYCRHILYRWATGEAQMWVCLIQLLEGLNRTDLLLARGNFTSRLPLDLNYNSALPAYSIRLWT